jgi:hypothetical protein
MELKKKYIVLEINESEEDVVKEWAKSKEIKIAPKTFKGVSILEELALKFKEECNQIVIEEFIQSLIFPMEKELNEEEITVKVLIESEYEDEYEINKIYLSDKNLETEIKLFYDIENIAEMFKKQIIGIYDDIYSEIEDDEKESYGYDETERISGHIFKVKKEKYNTVF